MERNKRKEDIASNNDQNPGTHTDPSLCVVPPVNGSTSSLDVSLAKPPLKKQRRLDASQAEPPLKKQRRVTPLQKKTAADIAIQQTTATANQPTAKLTAPPGLCVLYQLEPHTHLYTAMQVDELVSCISKILQKLGIVFQFKAAKHKFKCELHARSSFVKFRVRIFKAHSGECIVEAQKRRSSDSIVLFCDIWKALKGVLTSSKHVDDVTPLDTLEPTTQHTPKIKSGPPPSLEATCCGLSTFTSMAKERCTEIRHIGVCGLAVASDNATYTIAMSKSTDAVRQLCVAVSSTNSEIRTHALRAISNILTLTHSNQLSSDTGEQIIAAIKPIVASLEADNINLNVQAAQTLKCILEAFPASKPELVKHDALTRMQECEKKCKDQPYHERFARAMNKHVENFIEAYE